MEDTVMNLTADQFEQLVGALKSQEGSNSAILVFAGIIAVAGIVFIMWWVLNLKLEPLEKLSKELSEAVKSLNEKIHDLTSKMWSPEALDNKIKVEVQDQIQEHIRNCPYKDKLNQ